MAKNLLKNRILTCYAEKFGNIQIHLYEQTVLLKIIYDFRIHKFVLWKNRNC